MKITTLGRVDRNKTVEQLMGEVARTGNRYLDLATGNYMAIVSDVAPAPKPEETEKYTEEELAKLSMSKLRKIGNPLGAYDTKKSELIAEILEKQ